jgi:hypothetical protein
MSYSAAMPSWQSDLSGNLVDNGNEDNFTTSRDPLESIS